MVFGTGFVSFGRLGVCPGDRGDRTFSSSIALRALATSSFDILSTSASSRSNFLFVPCVISPLAPSPSPPRSAFPSSSGPA